MKRQVYEFKAKCEKCGNIEGCVFGDTTIKEMMKCIICKSFVIVYNIVKGRKI